MAANERPERVIRFDLFELDLHSFQLRRNGLPVEIGPQALRLVTLLASRPDELVTRTEIKEKLWPDESHGDFDSRLNFAVRKLREALRDDADLPRYVQTERKLGYRFIAPVREMPGLSSFARHPPDHSEPGQGATSAESTREGSIARKRFRVGVNGLFLALVTVAMVAVAAAVVLTLRLHEPGQRQISPRSPLNQSEEIPQILSVTPILPQARQRIVIKGTGLGLHVPYVRADVPYLAVRDKSAHWSAGRLIPQNWDEVTLDVESWTDDQIVINGFSGDYGSNGWKLNEGDEVEIAVWNPQSGAGPARYPTSVVTQRTAR